jgi:hypothetical protein
MAEAMRVLLFFWEGEWEVGVSIVHSLHDPHVSQYFDFYFYSFLCFIFSLCLLLWSTDPLACSPTALGAD